MWPIDIAQEDLGSDSEENEPTPKPSEKQASKTNNARHGVESNDEQVVDNVEDVNLPASVNEQVLPVHKRKYSGNGSSAIQQP
jgi:hypothetical protein